MVKTYEEVANWFAKGEKPKGENSTGTLFFEGNIIYSYGWHFPIAVIVDRKDKFAIFNEDRCSVTTGTQKGIVKRVLLDNGFKLFNKKTQVVKLFANPKFQDTVCHYMHLKIAGLGTALSDEEVKILNSIPEEEMQYITEAIKDLGGY